MENSRSRVLPLQCFLLNNTGHGVFRLHSNSQLPPLPSHCHSLNPQNSPGNYRHELPSVVAHRPMLVDTTGYLRQASGEFSFQDKIQLSWSSTGGPANCSLLSWLKKPTAHMSPLLHQLQYSTSQPSAPPMPSPGCFPVRVSSSHQLPPLLKLHSSSPSQHSPTASGTLEWLPFTK